MSAEGDGGPVRPGRLVVMVGTGTEVGKTWVAARLSECLRARGMTVAARKPAQSFELGDGPTDADVLAEATGEDREVVCPPHRWYEVPMAPFMAAEALARPPFTLDDLVAEVSWPAPVDVGLVETAGGVASPICSDRADSADLADALRPDRVVLVADAGLGTLNSVRLCVSALGDHETVVFLNRYDDADDLHTRNRQWLEEHLPAPVAVSIPTLADHL